MVKYLYQHNHSSVEKVSTNGRTSLHTAALHGRSNIINFIINLGVIPLDTVDNCGSLPVMDAVRSGDVSSIESCISAPNGKQLLHQLNKTGQNCLHIAAEANQQESIKFLLHYFDINVRVCCKGSIFDGQTALHIAHLNDNHEAVMLLKELGADENIMDVDGRYPQQLTMRKCWVPHNPH